MASEFSRIDLMVGRRPAREGQLYEAGIKHLGLPLRALRQNDRSDEVLPIVITAIDSETGKYTYITKANWAIKESTNNVERQSFLADDGTRPYANGLWNLSNWLTLDLEANTPDPVT